MGPFPHDAPPAEISAHNPAGTDGLCVTEVISRSCERDLQLSGIYSRDGWLRGQRCCLSQP